MVQNEVSLHLYRYARFVRCNAFRNFDICYKSGERASRPLEGVLNGGKETKISLRDSTAKRCLLPR
jgi:hypothetical protein